MCNTYEYIPEVNLYFKDIKNYQPLSKEEEINLTKKIKNGDVKSLERLIVCNLKFVVNIAKMYRKTNIPFTDLISEGNIGLIKAAKKFDETKDVRFITYAVWWVKSSIQEYIDKYNNNNTLSLNEEIKIDNNDCKYHHINEDFENEINVINSRKDAINSLMDCLKERELKILTYYYGLDGNKEMTLEEIGNIFSLTQERIRKIKDKALVKLRSNALLSNEFEIFNTL